MTAQQGSRAQVAPTLGAFLRAKRDALSPQAVGIAPFPGKRKVPGLRREELAFAAGMSLDYYSRVEQDRQDLVSPGILNALSRALRLNPTEHRHLLDLAAARSIARPLPAAPQVPSAGLFRLMRVLERYPVLLLGFRGDVLAANDPAEALLGQPFPSGSSFPRYLFGPIARQRIVNWEQFASGTIAALRGEAARRPGDQELLDLVFGLCAEDADARRWWNDQSVADFASAEKTLQDPRHGRRVFSVDAVQATDSPDQRLVVYTPVARADRV